MWFLEKHFMTNAYQVHVIPRFRWAKCRFLFYVLSFLHTSYLSFKVVYCIKKERKLNALNLFIDRYSKQTKVSPVMLICSGPWPEVDLDRFPKVILIRIELHLYYIPQTSYRLFIICRGQTKHMYDFCKLKTFKSVLTFFFIMLSMRCTNNFDRKVYLFIYLSKIHNMRYMYLKESKNI